MNINSKDLPFEIRKTKEGYSCNLIGEHMLFWGDTKKEAIQKLFEQRIFLALGEANKLKALRDILEIRK